MSQNAFKQAEVSQMTSNAILLAHVRSINHKAAAMIRATLSKATRVESVEYIENKRRELINKDHSTYTNQQESARKAALL